MYYKNISDKSDWYGLEARDLNYDELYSLYTDIGDTVLTNTDRVGQIILTREYERVYLYFNSYAGEKITVGNFNSDVEPFSNIHSDAESFSNIHPLKHWLSANTPTTANQLSRERNTDESEYLEVSVENNAVIPRLISELEKDNTAKLVSITIRFDPIRRRNNSDNDNKPSNFYFCRPTEVSCGSDADSLLTKFNSLNAGVHSYEVADCSIETAIKSIYYRKIEYRDRKSLLLADNDIKYILYNK